MTIGQGGKEARVSKEAMVKKLGKYQTMCGCAVCIWGTETELNSFRDSWTGVCNNNYVWGISQVDIV